MINISEIVIGSSNIKKSKEILSIISDFSIKLRTLNDFQNVPEIDEDGKTFKENAIKKATVLSRWCNSIVISDDSGLEVEALNNRPGVYSARYAGPGANDDKRIKKLLKEMKPFSSKERKARFKCAIAVANPDKLIFAVESEFNGIITKEPLGNNGFGYDPVFFVPDYGKTFAELEADVKNKISHRAKALELFRIEFLKILCLKN